MKSTRKFPYLRRNVGRYAGRLSTCSRDDAHAVLVHLPGRGHKVPKHLARSTTTHLGLKDSLAVGAFRWGERLFEPSYYWAMVDDPYGVIADGIVDLAGAPDPATDGGKADA